MKKWLMWFIMIASVSLVVGPSYADLFDRSVAIAVPEKMAAEWFAGWKALTFHLVFQNAAGGTLFETPKTSVLPVYIGNADGQFEGIIGNGVYWRIDTSYDVQRVPKVYFDDPIQVSLEIDR